LGRAASGQNQNMPHPTAVVAAAVYGSSIAAHLAAEKYRREHPVPTASEWARMWQVANTRERAIMTRWSQRWTYPKGDERTAMDHLMYRALREPQMQARIAHLEHAVGIGGTTPGPDSRP
jgi:hypothetical protein